MMSLQSNFAELRDGPLPENMTAERPLAIVVVASGADLPVMILLDGERRR
jgi:hypothetical protein